MKANEGEIRFARGPCVFALIAIAAAGSSCATAVNGPDPFPGCAPPPPSVFKKVGVDLGFAQSTFGKLAIGTIDIKVQPEVVNLASQAATDAQITDYLRCLALKRDQYTKEQAVYLQELLGFFASKPTAEQYIQWKEKFPFPSSIASPPEPQLTFADVILVKNGQKAAASATETTDVAQSIDFRFHNKGAASISASRLRLTVLEFSEQTQRAEYEGNDVLPSSETYNLDLSDLRKKDDSTEIEVSHLVKKDDADRFIVVATAKSRFNTLYNRKSVWKLHPVLVTSHGRIEGPDFTVTIPVPRAR